MIERCERSGEFLEIGLKEGGFLDGVYVPRLLQRSSFGWESSMDQGSGVRDCS